MTPNHLLFGRRLETSCNSDPAETVHDDININLLKRKRFIDLMLDHFWKRWRREYLTSLREHQRKFKDKHSQEIGIHDIVLIYEEKQPRHSWKMGRVEKLIVSEDGEVRGAEI